MGPTTKSIEIFFYKQVPFFRLKSIAFADRPAALEVLNCPGVKILCTDHTSFESSINKDIMDCCEFQLYAHMLKHHPNREKYLAEVKYTMGSKQHCRFKECNVICEGRMSGEMSTSLGNGFTNLMAMAFVAHKLGWPTLEGFVEGDDGVFKVAGTLPTAKDFSDLGFDIKIEIHDDVCESTFCQVVYDRADLTPCVSPLKAILTTCWTDSKFRNTRKKSILCELLKAKVDSLRYRAYNNPVIWAFGKKLDSFIGQDVKPKHEKKYNYSVDYSNMHPWQSPSDSMRLLCEKVWSISIAEQLFLEEFFSSMVDFSPITDERVLSIFDILSSGTCRDYAARYVIPFRVV
jgi:hypothetical protein